jgi:2'-5' RNA ligase
LTIARNKPESNSEFPQALKELRKIKISETFNAGSVELMESELLTAGPKYGVVKRFRLS